MTGDHQMHGSKPGYGKVLAALYTPSLISEFPQIKSFSSYTPDIAPSLLELLGTSITNLNIGKSFMSTRESYQHLVSREFSILNNTFVQSKSCDLAYLKQVKIEKPSGLFNNCQLAKINTLYDIWILRDDLYNQTP